MYAEAGASTLTPSPSPWKGEGSAPFPRRGEGPGMRGASHPTRRLNQRPRLR